MNLIYLLSILIISGYNSVICHAKQLLHYIKVTVVQLVEVYQFWILTHNKYSKKFCRSLLFLKIWRCPFEFSEDSYTLILLQSQIFLFPRIKGGQNTRLNENGIILLGLVFQCIWRTYSVLSAKSNKKVSLSERYIGYILTPWINLCLLQGDRHLI